MSVRVHSRRWCREHIVIAFAVLASGLAAERSFAQGVMLDCVTLSSGGGVGAQGILIVGQVPVGHITGARHSAECGFLACLQESEPTGDLNGDGLVDGGDLGILLGTWGSAGPADLNADGVVDGADLGLFLGFWS